MKINTNKKIFSYENFAALCRNNIKTNSYYKILNDGNVIYTTLYVDKFQGEIKIKKITIIFLAYDVNEVEKAVKKSLIEIDDEYKSDREIAIKMVLWCCYSLKNLDKKFSNDKELILLVFKNQHIGYIMTVLSDELKDDKEIVSLCVRYSGYYLKYASERLRSDKEVIMLAVSNDIYSLRHASIEMQNEPDIIKIISDKTIQLK